MPLAGRRKNVSVLLGNAKALRAIQRALVLLRPRDRTELSPGRRGDVAGIALKQAAANERDDRAVIERARAGLDSNDVPERPSVVDRLSSKRISGAPREDLPVWVAVRMDSLDGQDAGVDAAMIDVKHEILTWPLREVEASLSI